MQTVLLTRRSFLASGATALAGALAGAEPAPAPLGIPVHQESLPYGFAGLEPHLDADLVRQHYQKIHGRQCRQLQALLRLTDLHVGNVTSLMPALKGGMILPGASGRSRPSLGRLIDLGQSEVPPPVFTDEALQLLRFCAGGHINHTAYWRFMAPAGSSPGEPQGQVRAAIEKDFGSLTALREVFVEAALSRAATGQGWAWLVYRPDDCLVVTTTPAEDNPLMTDFVPAHEQGRPILGVDLWKHAYAYRHQHHPDAYLDAWWRLVNWPFVAKAYAIVSARRLAGR